MTQQRFRIEQTSERRGGYWDWAMQIVPQANASLDDVKSVTYGLHPVFPNPNRVIRSNANGFELRMDSSVKQNETWGRFDVRVTVLLKQGDREIHVVPLTLANADQSPAPELFPLPIDADFVAIRVWYESLVRKGAYGWARQALDQAAQTLQDNAARNEDPAVVAKRRLWLSQQRALCTYKDGSLPSDTRLRDALEILEKQCGLNLTTCDDPETLGLGGAVYKRLWDLNRDRSHLELALACYRKGYKEMLASTAHDPYDAGAFTGVNVAFVCELLALEIPLEVDAGLREARLTEAQDMRLRLAHDLQRFDQNSWWIAATLLEVYFGLACSDRAYVETVRDQASRIAQVDASPWQRQSTGMQLVRLARLHKRLGRSRPEDVDALLTEVLCVAFNDQVVVSEREGVEGKVGLALSGGGFRASLFHIGVLARLAELDLLRHVEVISCVSGGSIVGAHYYLLLRKVLQETPDGSIGRDKYIEVVKQLLEQFLAGVQKNIRMRVAASLVTNLRMLFQPSHYSRTQRLGSLYEKYLYAKVEDDEGRSPRWLNEAFIVPKNKDGSYADAFSPRVDNWGRDAKVPMLVLNATTLNTGRNWQFTASFMGEPRSYGTTADATERLDAVYFNEAPERWQRFRLGDAVAASSCVPALFTPIVIPELFKGRTVRLVDGGVHDNQGTRALLDQDCDLVIVSDASGQMDSQLNPPHGELGVALRTNSILQARVRIAQHQELQARIRTGQLRECAFLHLRKGLERAVQHASAQSTTIAGTEPALAPGDVTEYKIERRVQAALAAVRTDLDSFTDREALSLMYSGYTMAQTYLASFVDARIASQPVEPWRFLEVRQACEGHGQRELRTESLLRHLRAGARLAFKVWHLHPALSFIRILVLAVVAIGSLAALVHLVVKQVKIPLDLVIDVGGLAKMVLIALVPLVLAIVFPMAKAWVARAKPALNPGSVVGRIVFGVLMASGGWFLCRLHLWVFDRLFLRLGRVKPRETISQKPA